MSPQKLKLKSTPVKQERKTIRKNEIKPAETKDFLDLYSGYLNKKRKRKINNISIKILKDICLEVINGNKKDLKTKK